MKKRNSIIIVAFILITSIFTGCSSFEPEPTPTPLPHAGEYDKVLASGDGYYLVQKYEETYNSAVMKFGIFDQNGEWVLPLSGNNIFVKAYESSYGKTDFQGNSRSTAYTYFGSGVFLATEGVKVKYPGEPIKKIGPTSSLSSGGMTCFFYNTATKKSFSFEAREITPYDNGYLLLQCVYG